MTNGQNGHMAEWQKWSNGPMTTEWPKWPKGQKTSKVKWSNRINSQIAKISND